jgi:hypothetical protein
MNTNQQKIPPEAKRFRGLAEEAYQNFNYADARKFEKMAWEIIRNSH